MSEQLKRYQSIKQVHAEPMAFGEFNDTIRKVDPGKTLDPLAIGFHVVYSKDTTDEYHSWSPHKQFVENHLEIPEHTVAVAQTGKVS